MVDLRKVKILLTPRWAKSMLRRGFNMKDPIASAFSKIAGKSFCAAKKFSNKASCNVNKVYGFDKMKGGRR